MITKSELFTHDVVYAILKRKEEVNKIYVRLSQLMDMYDMKSYTSMADKLIMNSDDFVYTIDNYHIAIDVFKNETLLDIAALHIFRDILEGFIESERYMKFLEYIESCEELRGTNNMALGIYRDMSSIKLIKSMITHGKYKKSMSYEVKMIRYWCALELLSRTYLPRLYYILKELPAKIKMKSVTHYLESHLQVNIPDRD